MHHRSFMRFLEKSDSDQAWNVIRELCWPCAQKKIRIGANSGSQEFKMDSSVHVIGLTKEERMLVSPIMASMWSQESCVSS